MSTPGPRKWEVSPEFPEGRWMPLTAEEIAQLEKDRVEGEAASVVAATALVNERTLDERLELQLPILRTAIDAMTANPPTLFAGLSNQERVFLRRLARNQADLIKLRLRDLESPD